MAGPWEKYQTEKPAPDGPWNKYSSGTSPESQVLDEESPWDYAKRSVGGLAVAAQDMVPFIEPLRKLGYAREGIFGDKPFDEGYAEEQAFQEGERARMRKNAPEWAKGVGTAAGVVPNLAVGIPSKTIQVADKASKLVKAAAGVGNAAIRTGSAAGMSGLEQGLSNPYQLFDSEEAQAGAGTAGLFQGGVELVAPGAGKAGKKFLDYVDDSAASRALKAGTGWTERFMKRYSRDQRRQMGKELLSTDEAGKPVVGWFSNVGDIAERVKPKRDHFGRVIGETGRIIDEAQPGTAIQGPTIAAELKDWIKRNVGPAFKVEVQKEVPTGILDEAGNPITKTVTKNVKKYNPDDKHRLSSMKKQVKYFEDIGDVPFADIQKLKSKTFKHTSPVDPSSPFMSPADFRNAVRGSIGSEQERAAQRVSEEFPELSDTAKDYIRAKRKYQAYEPVLDAAEERRARDEGIRWLSPSDMAVGGLSGVSGALIGGLSSEGDPSATLSGLGTGLSLALAHRQVRTRGAAFGARSLDALSEAARGPNAKSIRNALRNGTGAFTASQVQERLSEAERDWMARQLEPTRPGF